MEIVKKFVNLIDNNNKVYSRSRTIIFDWSKIIEKLCKKFQEDKLLSYEVVGIDKLKVIKIYLDRKYKSFNRLICKTPFLEFDKKELVEYFKKKVGYGTGITYVMGNYGIKKIEDIVKMGMGGMLLVNVEFY